MSAASPFNPRLVIGLIAAGIAAFAALLLLLAYGGGLAPPRSGGSANVLSPSATGFKGLQQLVGRFHPTAIVRERAQLSTDTLLIVTVDDRTSAADLRTLLQWRLGRATLIILPKWITQPDPTRRGWVRALGTGLGQIVAGGLQQGFSAELVDGRRDRNAVGTDLLSGLSFPLPESTQVVNGESITPLASLTGGALIAQLREQPHYILADPDLLNNHGLRERANARAALDLVAALSPTGADMVHFDMSLSGLAAGSAPNALRLAFEPPFLVLTLALFVAALLAGLHGAFRFGPVRKEERTIAFGKAALVENSAGLIRLAGREARLGAAYADVMRHEAARAASAPLWLQGEALDQYLDRIGHGGFSALSARLAGAQDRHSLMAAARALFQWKKDIIK